MRSCDAIIRMARQLFVALTCAALTLWTISPNDVHVPEIIETLQEHAEMINSHGHSHGLEEDLLWALHGHSHDVVDHDHSQAVLVPGRSVQVASTVSTIWRSSAVADWTPPHFRLDRPPRV